MDDDNRITYTYRLLNNVSDVAEEIIKDTEKAGVSVKDLMDKEKDLKTTSKDSVSVITADNERLLSDMKLTKDNVSKYSDDMKESHNGVAESVKDLNEVIGNVGTESFDTISRSAEDVKQKIESLEGTDHVFDNVGRSADTAKQKIESLKDAEGILQGISGSTDNVKQKIEALKDAEGILQDMGDTADETTHKIDQIGTKTNILTDTAIKQEELTNATKRATNSLKDQQDTLMKQTMGFMAIGHAVSGVTGGLRQMGIVSDDTALKLQKVNGAFQLINGAITGLKALNLIMKTIQATEAGTAIIETYRATLQNPYKAALVGVGLGTAIGIGGALMMQNNQPQAVSNSSETVIVNFNTETQRGYGQDVADVVIR